ncbi:MAG: FtsX-like permease family protein [Gammaproteobacteria bacterium]
MKLLDAISGLKTDWRHALHGRRLSFKLGVIATLAIAVAANIAVLGNLGVLFGPVVPGATHQHLIEPYLQPMEFKALPPSAMGVSRPVYDGLASTLKGRAETALYWSLSGTLSINNGNPRQIAYVRATPSLAQVLGIQVMAGRMLNSADSLPGAASVIVISENLARSQFGSAGAAIGRILTLNGETTEVVGVLPAAVTFPSGSLSEEQVTQAWLPLPPEQTGLLDSIQFNMHALVYPLVPLAPGTLRGALESTYQESLSRYIPGMRHYLVSTDMHARMATLAEREYGPVLTRLQVLGIAAVLLLLLVFANLAGLATADALARRQEFATRMALGARPLRLFAGRLRELLALGLIGGIFGIGLGWLGSRALSALVGQTGQSAVFSAPVLLATLAAVVIIALLLSLAGLRRLRAPGAAAADLTVTSHSTGGPRLVRTLRALVVLQLAASLILLLTAAHLQSNVFGLKHQDLGFIPAQRSFFSVMLPGGEGDQTEAQYQAYVKQVKVFDQELLERVGATAGVRQVSALSAIPFANSAETTNVRSAPGLKSQLINLQIVSRGIIPTLGLQVLAGNPAAIFLPGSAPGVLLDENAVSYLWPGTSTAQAIGREVYMDGKPWRVAALIKPIRMQPYGSIGASIFIPQSKSDYLSGSVQSFVVHSALPLQALRSTLTRIAHLINAQAQITAFRSVDELIAQAYSGRNRLSQVFGLVALVTLVIAAVGLFALLAYRALVRRPEFAIRGALGATPTRLFTYVLVEAAVLWIISCIVGLPLAYLLSVELAVHLPALGTLAPWIAAAVAIALGVAALVAALVPALRVSRTELTQSLKQ